MPFSLAPFAFKPPSAARPKKRTTVFKAPIPTVVVKEPLTEDVQYPTVAEILGRKDVKVKIRHMGFLPKPSIMGPRQNKAMAGWNFIRTDITPEMESILKEVSPWNPKLVQDYRDAIASLAMCRHRLMPATWGNEMTHKWELEDKIMQFLETLETLPVTHASQLKNDI